MRRATRLLVIAKAPVAGRSKTRLCPPCSPDEAAMLAEAALCDTLDAVMAVERVEPVLVLEGEVAGWAPEGLPVIAQRGRGLDERLAAAFDDAGTPALLIGMDTPQVTASLLEASIDALSDVDAVLGRATDGGWWAAGMHRTHPRAFLGVEMSSAATADEQLARWDEIGWRTDLLPELRDVDTFDDARAVADAAPDTRFARTLARLHA